MKRMGVLGLKRKVGVLVFYIFYLAVLTIYSSTQTAFAQEKITSESAQSLGLTEYRYFIVYPHLEKALRAQQSGNEELALKEFERARQLAPESIPLLMYLVEAYKQFGDIEQARLVLEQALARNPEDTHLQQQLAALPKPALPPITTAAELKWQLQLCDEEPTAECRLRIAYAALNLEDIHTAKLQLFSFELLNTPQASQLEHDVLQRALYLQQWTVADELFTQAHKRHELKADDYTRWFQALINGQLDDRIAQLQQQGLFIQPEQHLLYAHHLLQRNSKQSMAALKNYVDTHTPKFATAEQEQGWLYLYLLSYPKSQRAQALTTYHPLFDSNARFMAEELLHIANDLQDTHLMQQALTVLPANQYLEQRYFLSKATHQKSEALRVSRALYNKQPDAVGLDTYTWRLMELNEPVQAIRLLLAQYPFQGQPQTVKKLLQRLSELLKTYDYSLNSEQQQKLLAPLSTPSLREIQSQLYWFEDDCPALQRLLADHNSKYEATTWSRLALCYEDTAPGLALYAYQQAAQRNPTAEAQRAVAYMAYELEEYDTSLKAWQQLEQSLKLEDTHPFTTTDLQAATLTAHQANHPTQRDTWLDLQSQRGLENTQAYWWMQAQRYYAGHPSKALDSLNRALALEPTAQAYALRASIYQDQKKWPEAEADLLAAANLEPNNSRYQAALGYVWWNQNRLADSRAAHEVAIKAVPNDLKLAQQLTYVNQRLDDGTATQKYSEKIIDNLNYKAQIQPLSTEQKQQLFDFRRIHEEAGRKWTFNLDAAIGLRKNSIVAATPASGATTTQDYRSFGQLEAEYRVGRNKLIADDLLALYGRVYGDSSDQGHMWPIKTPMLAAGVRWKPWLNRIIFLSLEHQVPLNHHGRSDTLIRLSGSFFNGGRFSDEWHPNGKGWLAQNLYLDAGHYLQHNAQTWTADYRLSWHQKINNGQTLEPYMHVQTAGFKDGDTQARHLAGLGVRWNYWHGDSHYQAWPHKFSVGFEWQHAFKNINQPQTKRNAYFINVGWRW